jgi:Spy/CpxP family protein refolding chaperone
VAVTRRIALALVVLAIASSAFAIDVPPGKWWRRPEVVQRLGLSEEQQTRLDGIFRGAANELIDMKGEVEKANIALRAELDQPRLDRENIRRAAARLNDARARLFTRELMMLTDMRAVLTDTQWNTMRAELDRMSPRRGAPQIDSPMGKPRRRQ